MLSRNILVPSIAVSDLTARCGTTLFHVSAPRVPFCDAIFLSGHEVLIQWARFDRSALFCLPLFDRAVAISRRFVAPWAKFVLLGRNELLVPITVRKRIMSSPLVFARANGVCQNARKKEKTDTPPGVLRRIRVRNFYAEISVLRQKYVISR